MLGRIRRVKLNTSAQHPEPFEAIAMFPYTMLNFVLCTLSLSSERPAMPPCPLPCVRDYHLQFFKDVLHTSPGQGIYV